MNRIEIATHLMAAMIQEEAVEGSYTASKEAMANDALAYADALIKAHQDNRSCDACGIIGSKPWEHNKDCLVYQANWTIKNE